MPDNRHLPENYERFVEAKDEADFFARKLEGKTNLVWLPRQIKGAYNELAQQLYIAKTWCEQMMTRRDDIREKLEDIATHEGDVGDAARQVKADQDLIVSKGLEPDFRIVGPDFYEYAIYEPHMDIGDPDDEFGTFSCNYTAPVTGIARNEDTEFAYTTPLDRVFQLKEGVEKFHVGVGDIFRMAAYQNKNKVEGVVHWAHRMREGDPLRMILMARHRP